MSQIFDALLRSETERAGERPVPPAEATELLRSVEGQVAPRLAEVSLFDQNGTRHGDHHSLFDDQIAAAHLDGTDVSTLAQPASITDIFGQFQALSVSIPLGSRLVCLTDQKNVPTSDAIRLLAVRLRDVRRTRTLKKVLITSTVPREGKSTVAANLACALALKTEEKVLLIDGDVRRPSQSVMFNTGDIPGLCELLLKKRSLAESIYRLEGIGLWMLPAGDGSRAPLELLQSAKLPLLMDQLSSLFDWIIVDSPPVLPLADTSVWARMIDGILLVTRQGVTEKQQLEKGLKALESRKLLGALLNCSHISKYSSYYYNSSAAS
jgi:capsular exopolysaccharide synthesis family protein